MSDGAYDIEALRTTVAEQPDSAEAHLQLAEALHTLGELDEGLIHLGRAADLHTADADGYRRMATLFMWWLGDYTQAKAAIDAAIRLDPESAENRQVAAVIEYEVGDPAKGRAILEELREGDDANWSEIAAGMLRMLESPSYSRTGTAVPKRIRTYRKARSRIERRPRSARAHVAYANACRALAMADGARNAYAKAVALKPASAELHMELAELLVWGEPERALEEIEAAVGLGYKDRNRPWRVVALKTRALAEAGRVTEAKAIYEELLASGHAADEHLVTDYVMFLHGRGDPQRAKQLAAEAKEQGMRMPALYVEQLDRIEFDPTESEQEDGEFRSGA